VADFVMPSLGADMEAGTIVEWRVHPGDVVHRGDIVAVVDTDKSDIEVEVFEDGVVEELLVDEGRSVPVGTPLARLGPSPATGAPVAAVAPAAVTAGGPAGEGGRVAASPYARRRAAEAGVDLHEVTGTGPGGAVRAEDLPAAAAPQAAPAAPAAPPAARAAPRDRTESGRQAVAALMARSAREVPHYYLASTIDLGPALAWLAERNAARPVAERLLPAALLLKATALAARRVPTVNGTYDDGFRPAAAVHLGVAIALRGGGLVAPALHDADQLDLDDLMAQLRDLVARARAGRLRGAELRDPTLTVTNLGDEGAEEVFGVIAAPQVALVGFGRIVERAWAVDGMVGARPTVRVTLAADHRASEGHEGSRFLAAIDQLLREPEGL
jgi:pyruvate dehydrogenase E2 component (dihydrolipoamide acetyltransferase)